MIAKFNRIFISNFGSIFWRSEKIVVRNMSRTQNQGVFFEKKKKVLKKMHFLKLISSLQLKADGWNTIQLPVQGIPVASLQVFLPLVSVRVDASCGNTKGGIT